MEVSLAHGSLFLCSGGTPTSLCLFCFLGFVLAALLQNFLCLKYIHPSTHTHKYTPPHPGLFQTWQEGILPFRTLINSPNQGLPENPRSYLMLLEGRNTYQLPQT